MNADIAEKSREKFLPALAEALAELRWPDFQLSDEDTFNRTRLPDYCRTVWRPAEMTVVEQSSLKRLRAGPFFGWGVSDEQPQRGRRVEPDLTFKTGPNAFLVENKIIRERGECEIKNSLVQVVEYLWRYEVDAGILLILDEGRGASMDWHSGPEQRLIDAITVAYPICVARIRKNRATYISVR
jgi:hypothetical protein